MSEKEEKSLIVCSIIKQNWAGKALGLDDYFKVCAVVEYKKGQKKFCQNCDLFESEGFDTCFDCDGKLSRVFVEKDVVKD